MKWQSASNLFLDLGIMAPGEPRESGIHHRLHAGRIGHVAFDAQRLTPARFDCRCEVFKLLLAARGEDHVGAGLGEGLGHGHAKAVGRAGDDRCFAADIENSCHDCCCLRELARSIPRPGARNPPASC